MRKCLAIAAAIAAFGSVLAIGTASAQTEVTFQHIVTVTKVVEGAVPDEAKFVVEVECGAKDYDLTFDEDGGTKSVTVGSTVDGPQTCAVEEANGGGASDTEISGSPCEFTAIDAVDADQVCDVTVENSFDESTTTTAAPPVIVEQPAAGAAPVIVASPVLTG